MSVATQCISSSFHFNARITNYVPITVRAFISESLLYIGVSIDTEHEYHPDAAKSISDSWICFSLLFSFWKQNKNRLIPNEKILQVSMSFDFLPPDVICRLRVQCRYGFCVETLKIALLCLRVGLKRPFLIKGSECVWMSLTSVGLTRKDYYYRRIWQMGHYFSGWSHRKKISLGWNYWGFCNGNDGVYSERQLVLGSENQKCRELLMMRRTKSFFNI